MEKKGISLKAAIIGIGVTLMVALIGTIGYFIGQVQSTATNYQNIYFDTLYQASQRLINADRDFYQAMLGATQLYDYGAYLDADTTKTLLEDYATDEAQAIDRVTEAADIAKTDNYLWNGIEVDGTTYSESFSAYVNAFNIWKNDFDINTMTGDFTAYTVDFIDARVHINTMTEILEEWAEYERARITKDIQNRIMGSVIILVLLVIVLAVISVLVVHNMRTSLNDMDKKIQRLADGDFTQPVVIKTPFTEFLKLAHDNEIMRSKLRDAILKVIDDSNKVGVEADATKNSIRDSQSVMNDISTAVENLAVGATAMADDVQNTSAITIDIGSAIDEVSSSVDQTLVKVQLLSDSFQEVQEGLDALMKADAETDEKAGQVADSVNETAEVVSKISTAADGIISIAGQTNLLALNASIEAARAGDAGRGFSVVAENIKGLATESDRLAGEITTMLKDISNYSENNKKLTSSIKEATAAESESLEKMLADFKNMLNILQDAKNDNEGAAEQTRNMSSKKDGILDSVESLSSISEENAASTEETSASLDQLNNNMETVVEQAEDLTRIAADLRQSVEYFRI
ncbi:MAG: methyl-accepting chemotaxis protein [Lachnospiraceae bacterium]|nr:methyl-accepting chemotaxis protein [Lachnospiraceae bacterium]